MAAGIISCYCKDSAPVFAGAASFYPLAENKTAVQPAGASGAAGEQRYKIPVLPDQNSVYIIGVDDLYAHDPVSQSLLCKPHPGVEAVPYPESTCFRSGSCARRSRCCSFHRRSGCWSARGHWRRLTCVFTQTKGTKALPDFHVHLIAVHGGRCDERLALQMLPGHIFIQSGIET